MKNNSQNIHKIKADRKKYFYNFENNLENKVKDTEELQDLISKGVANISVIKVGVFDKLKEDFNVVELERFTHFDIDFKTNTVTLNNPSDFEGKYLIISRTSFNKLLNMFNKDNPNSVSFSLKAQNENTLGFLYNQQYLEDFSSYKYIEDYNVLLSISGRDFDKDHIFLDNINDILKPSIWSLENSILDEKDLIDDYKVDASVRIESIKTHFNSVKYGIHPSGSKAYDGIDDFYEKNSPEYNYSGSGKGEFQYKIDEADVLLAEGYDVYMNLLQREAKDRWLVGELLKLPSSVAEQNKERLLKPDGVERLSYDKQVKYLKDYYPNNIDYDFSQKNPFSFKFYNYANKTATNLGEMTNASNNSSTKRCMMVGDRIFVFSINFALREEDVDDINKYYCYVFDTNLNELISLYWLKEDEIDFSLLQVIMSHRVFLGDSYGNSTNNIANFDFCVPSRTGNFIFSSAPKASNEYTYNNYKRVSGVNTPLYSFCDLRPFEGKSFELSMTSGFNASFAESKVYNELIYDKYFKPIYFYDKIIGDLWYSFDNFLRSSIEIHIHNYITNYLTMFNEYPIPRCQIVATVKCRVPDYLPPDKGKSTNINFTSNTREFVFPVIFEMPLHRSLKPSDVRMVKSFHPFISNGSSPIEPFLSMPDAVYKISGSSDRSMYGLTSGDFGHDIGLYFRGKYFKGSNIDHNYPSSLFGNPSTCGNRENNSNNYSIAWGSTAVGESNNVIQGGDNYIIFGTANTNNGTSKEFFNHLSFYYIKSSTGEVVEIFSKSRNELMTELGISAGTSYGQIDNVNTFEYLPSLGDRDDDKYGRNSERLIRIFNFLYVYLFTRVDPVTNEQYIDYKFIKITNDIFPSNASASERTFNINNGKYRMEFGIDGVNIVSSSLNFNYIPKIYRLEGNRFIGYWDYDLIDNQSNTKIYDGAMFTFKTSKSITFDPDEKIIELKLGEDILNDTLEPIAAVCKESGFMSNYNSGLNNYANIVKNRNGSYIFFTKQIVNGGVDVDGAKIGNLVISSRVVNDTVSIPDIPDDENSNEYKNYIVKAPFKGDIEGTDLDGEFIELE